MSKLGIYVILRLTMLLFGEDLRPASGAPVLYGGIATLIFGDRRRACIAGTRTARRLFGAGLLKERC